MNGRASKPNVPALKIGGGGLGARRGMKLSTSAISAANGSPDPQQNAFSKYAHVVYVPAEGLLTIVTVLPAR